MGAYYPRGPVAPAVSSHSGAVLERPGPADFARWFVRRWQDYAVPIAAVLILLAVAALSYEHARYQRDRIELITRLADRNRELLDAIARKLEIEP